jgi:glycosyltransferase involved in cell wall biosynthesis
MTEGQRTSRRELSLLSIVTPVLNEEEIVEELHRRISTAVEGLPVEIVIVDDGSTDRTPELLQQIADRDERVRIARLSRNFGHQAALTAGLDHARGDAVVLIDGDLQDPPELIPKMIERWRHGADVISAVREARAGESRMKLATARWFYRVFGRVAQIDLPPESGDFRLLDRAALDALLGMRERARFLRGMTVWVGFEQETISYERDARYSGETKYTLPRMIRFSLDAVSSFSYRPLQAATLLGFTISLLALASIPIAIILKLTGNVELPSITTVLIAVLLLGGIQLITVGIIGEYLGRVYEEVKSRPLYVVRDRINLLPPESPDGR